MYRTVGDERLGFWNGDHWEPLPDAPYRRLLEKGLKVARQEVAPELLTIPLDTAQRGGRPVMSHSDRPRSVPGAGLRQRSAAGSGRGRGNRQPDDGQWRQPLAGGSLEAVREGRALDQREDRARLQRFEAEQERQEERSPKSAPGVPSSKP
jgi:hypothetical protein